MIDLDISQENLGVVLSLFAVLIVSFGIDFRFSRASALLHPKLTRFFLWITVIGEVSAALALLLTWVAVWSPATWETIDDKLVLVPGTVAILCVLILTIKTVLSHFAEVNGTDDDDIPEAADEGDPHDPDL